VLVRDRIAKVCKVVRYAFRATPEVVREATSASLRDKRRGEPNPDPLEGDEPLRAPKATTKTTVIVKPRAAE
jgi:hypothetical protein